MFLRINQQNLYVKSAKVQNCKTKLFRIFLKNNRLKTCTIQEKFVPLQHSCKIDIRQRNLRHSQRVNFS